jgi:hypothetical protein
MERFHRFWIARGSFLIVQHKRSMKKLGATRIVAKQSDIYIELRLRDVRLKNCFCLPRFCRHEASNIKPSAVAQTLRLHSAMVAILTSCPSPNRRWSRATMQDPYGPNTDDTTGTPQSVSGTWLLTFDKSSLNVCMGQRLSSSGLFKPSV